MSFYYPQAAVELRILPEDYKLKSDASLQKIIKINVQARNISLTINDYRTTDTFSMDIDFKSFPFDPRSIRACGVVIYMQDMEKLYKPDGSLNTITPGEFTKLDPTITNAVFSGYVDTETIKLDDAKQNVHFEGRDFTALLIDQKYESLSGKSAPLALTQPLDKVIGGLLKQFPATSQIKIVNRTDNDLPTLAQFYPDFGSPQGGQRNSGSKESYWEIIQDIVNKAGLICYMHVDQLIIMTPRNQASTKNDDIKFIYGANVKSLELKRKLGRLKGFNIRVRSRVGKQVLQADIPREATQQWCTDFGVPKEDITIPVLKPDGTLDKPTTGGTTQTAPFKTFPVPKIANKDQLVRIGQTLFEQYSLQQLEGSFTTREMLGRGPTKSNTNNTVPFKAYDLTQLQKGQSLCIEIDTDDLKAISRLSDVNQRTDYLIKRSYDKTVAAVFAKTLGKFSPRFQITSYTMTLDQENGWDLTVHFQNILDVKQAGI